MKKDFHLLFRNSASISLVNLEKREILESTLQETKCSNIATTLDEISLKLSTKSFQAALSE